ncbi:MAG: hypothetical protein V4650_08440 [Pseudomonadota bacterium]
MTDITISVPDELAQGFQAAFPPEERSAVLAALLGEAVEREAERRQLMADIAQEREEARQARENGTLIPHEKVRVWLEAQARGEFVPWQA